MLPIFYIENYVIDTSKFDHMLHDSGVTKFEDEFADYVGAKYACSINSATSAIFLIFLEKNITVSVPSIIPPVVLNAVINSGNKVSFIDDIDWVGNSYILHDFGDYKVIDSAQKVQENQFQIEANPQDLMFFSFYPTKPVGSLDGGMIVSNDYDKIKYFKEAVLNGMSYATNNWERKIKFPGWKMYLSSFQAAIARQNLRKLPDKLSRLKEIREFYNENLGYQNISDHLYRIKTKNNRIALQNMKEQGIGCGIHYDALHLNEIYNNGNLFYCPKSKEEAETTLSIPFNEKLTEEEINYIAECVRQLP